MIGYVNIDNQGIAGIEKWLDGQGLAALHMAGLATDRLQRPVELARRSARAIRAARGADRGAREVQGEGRGRRHRRRAHRRDRRDGVGAGLRSEQSARAPTIPTRINRLTTGVYEMGSTFKALTLAMALDCGRITLDVIVRCARAAALRQVRRSTTIHAQQRVLTRAGDFHLFVEHRHRAHGALARRRVPQGVPEEARPARPAAHRVAGKRRAAGAEALGRAQHRHHRLRPRPFGRAAAGGDGRLRAGEWRQADSADLPQARPGGSGPARQARDQARDQPRKCAI